MKRIVTYKIFESNRSDGLTPEQEEFLNECTRGTWEYDPSTGLVNIEGDFNCSEKKLDDLKGIKFGIVSGYFDCYSNVLRSLEGAPQKVGGYFDCSYNRLTTLKGAPQYVGWYFECYSNELESLEGAPQNLDGGGFYCYSNMFKTLKGGPQVVGGDFDCSSVNLVSLEGAPKKVKGKFRCLGSGLESLVGAPLEIDGSFNCDLFKLETGEWNDEGRIRVWERSPSQKAKRLIFPLLPVEFINREIEKNPQEMMKFMKDFWDTPEFSDIQKKLKFPDDYGDFDKTIRSMKKFDDIKDFI